MSLVPSRPAVVGLALLAVALLAHAQRAQACPFCSAVSLTFCEEIASAEVAVIAKLTTPPPPPDDSDPLQVAKAKFQVLQVLKGDDLLGKQREIEAVYFGDSAVGSTFLMMGIDAPNLSWSTPIAISERGIEYVKRALELPKEGADRLFFFQDYLEDKDETLSRDAYDEFAKAPYADVLALAPRMHHKELIEWVQSTEVPVSRRRLYLTMLGAIRDPQDIPVLEAMIKSKDRQTKGALDALVAAYLTLKGPDGMPLVEELFLANKDAEYTDTYATIMAIRFHGTEEEIIPKERLLVGLRMMLDRPQLADLVIPDLARWEDWSVMERLVELFKTSNEESSWVRVPVINYLRACPLPVAQEKIDELAKVDPESIKRANSFFPLGAAVGGATAAKDDKPADDKPADDQAAGTADKKDAGKPAESEKAEAPQPEPAAGAAQGETKPTEKKTAAPEQTSSAPVPRAPSASRDQARSHSALGQLAPAAAAIPGPPARTTPIFLGLLGAAFILACAFWGILKGGQRATR